MPIKNKSYANRGMFLEHIINDTNTYYLSKDKAVIYKKPTPIKVLNVKYRTAKTTLIDKAVFSETSTLDYNGIYKGKYIEFDAKECHNKTSFPIENIKPHQIKHIRNVLKQKGIVFLIIFMNNEFYLLPGDKLINFIDNNDRKSIKYETLKELSISIKESFTPRLKYLDAVDEIYFKEM